MKRAFPLNDGVRRWAPLTASAALHGALAVGVMLAGPLGHPAPPIALELSVASSPQAAAPQAPAKPVKAQPRQLSAHPRPATRTKLTALPPTAPGPALPLPSPACGCGESPAPAASSVASIQEAAAPAPAASATETMPDPLVDYLQAMGEAIEGQIEYPPLARRMRWEGRTVLRCKVEPSGRLLEVAVASSSGREVLDAAAADALRRVQAFAPLPEGTVEAIAVEVPVRFRLVD